MGVHHACHGTNTDRLRMRLSSHIRHLSSLRYCAAHATPMCRSRPHGRSARAMLDPLRAKLDQICDELMTKPTHQTDIRPGLTDTRLFMRLIARGRLRFMIPRLFIPSLVQHTRFTFQRHGEQFEFARTLAARSWPNSIGNWPRLSERGLSGVPTSREVRIWARPARALRDRPKCGRLRHKLVRSAISLVGSGRKLVLPTWLAETNLTVPWTASALKPRCVWNSGSSPKPRNYIEKSNKQIALILKRGVDQNPNARLSPYEPNARLTLSSGALWLWGCGVAGPRAVGPWGAVRADGGLGGVSCGAVGPWGQRAWGRGALGPWGCVS